MSPSDKEQDVQKVSEAMKLGLSAKQIKTLVDGGTIELAGAEAGADCCPEGWVGIGHKPRFCIKIEKPPKIQICWG